MNAEIAINTLGNESTRLPVIVKRAMDIVLPLEVRKQANEAICRLNLQIGRYPQLRDDGLCLT
ncbi:hypothetical protein LXJ58_34385, partial [Escherichia coli]|nr:hypothetical protein [Escherichia coli]